MKKRDVIRMTKVDTAITLAFVGAILSLILGTLGLIGGIVVVALSGPWAYITVGLWAELLVFGILSMIGGILTFVLARNKLMAGGEELKMGAIFCIIFGCIAMIGSFIIGGILILVAGILGMIEWSEQKKAAEAAPPPPPPP